MKHSRADEAIHSLLGAVAPGGILVFVGHASSSLQYARAQGFEPSDYIEPTEVAAHLDDRWSIEIDETRPRTATHPDAPHSQDTVLRVRRRP